MAADFPLFSVVNRTNSAPSDLSSSSYLDNLANSTLSLFVMTYTIRMPLLLSYSSMSDERQRDGLRASNVNRHTLILPSNASKLVAYFLTAFYLDRCMQFGCFDCTRSPKPSADS